MFKKILGGIVLSAALTLVLPAVSVGSDTESTNCIKAEAAGGNIMYKCKRCKMVISVRPGDRPGQSLLFPCSEDDPVHEWQRIN